MKLFAAKTVRKMKL